MDIVENEDPSDRRWREIMQRPRADDQGISVVDWWDVRLKAQDWFEAKDIRPDEAALLLFGHKVPLEGDLERAVAEAKTLTIFDDGRKVSEKREGVYLSPEGFVRTLKVFSRFKREEPKARSLRAWLAIAESENLPHLSWVRAYITEKGWPLLEEPASVAAQEATSPPPAAGSSAQEDEPPAVAGRPTTSPPADPGPVRRRATLIEENRRRWPSIESDLKYARENGLCCAMTGRHGYWYEGKAKEWAKERGKWEAEKQGIELQVGRLIHCIRR
jgi:hypothetical protein